MVSQWALTILQKGINSFLALDPELFQRLATLKNKVLALDIKEIPTILYIQTTSDGLLLSTHHEGSIDTRLSGTFLSLVSLRSKNADNVSISGDIEFGQMFKEILGSFEIDWSYYLSLILGDVVAYQTEKTFLSFLSWGKQLSFEVFINAKEYVTEEALYSPPREEFDDFSNDVANCQMKIERLSQRVQHFKTVRKVTS